MRVQRSTEAQMKKRTTTTTSTRINVRKAIEQNKSLSHEEERLLRMRAGVSYDGTLEMKGQQFDHTRALLAMIEKEALQVTGQSQTASQPAVGEEAAKAAIIALLRDSE